MLPPGATHVVVSCGGNDAFGQLGTLQEKTTTLITALGRFSDLRGDFNVLYSRMLDRLLRSGMRIAVCTIYDAIPGMDLAALCAIALYNDVIVRRAAIAGVAVLELRAVCVCPEDYSAVSPIEPSSIGGAKIARLIDAFYRDARVLLFCGGAVCITSVHAAVNANFRPFSECVAARARSC